ncbi:MAG TPA: hypothetical protein VM681_07175, partial [Candidatus Thermoplasmatota archaeon]|nr:hypothetical protein [Candidatus Thermoplasmatota archaeon]
MKHNRAWDRRRSRGFAVAAVLVLLGSQLPAPAGALADPALPTFAPALLPLPIGLDGPAARVLGSLGSLFDHSAYVLGISGIPPPPPAPQSFAAGMRALLSELGVPLSVEDELAIQQFAQRLLPRQDAAFGALLGSLRDRHALAGEIFDGANELDESASARLLKAQQAVAQYAGLLAAELLSNPPSRTAGASPPLPVLGNCDWGVLVDLNEHDNVHACHYAFQLDFGGDDTYANNAGGAWGGLRSAFAMDLLGNDRYVGSDSVGPFRRVLEGEARSRDVGCANQPRHVEGASGSEALLLHMGLCAAEWDVVLDAPATSLHVATMSAHCPEWLEWRLAVRSQGSEATHAATRCQALPAGDAWEVPLSEPLMPGLHTFRLQWRSPETAWAVERFVDYLALEGPASPRRAHAGSGVDAAGGLLDVFGDDRYEARMGERAATAGSAVHGTGFLLDLFGNDAYDAAVGESAAHGSVLGQGVALLADVFGDDVYRSVGPPDRASALNGAAVIPALDVSWSLAPFGPSGQNQTAIAVLQDFRGNDRYVDDTGACTAYCGATNGASNAGARHQTGTALAGWHPGPTGASVSLTAAYAALVDQGGNDWYEVRCKALSQRNGEGGLLYDAQGQDVYLTTCSALGGDVGGPLGRSSAYQGRFWGAGVPAGTITHVCLHAQTLGRDTIVLRPDVGTAPIHALVVDATRSHAWNCASTSIPWSHESLFVHKRTANVSVSLAGAADLDGSKGTVSDDAGATWRNVSDRPAFKIVFEVPPEPKLDAGNDRLLGLRTPASEASWFVTPPRRAADATEACAALPTYQYVGTRCTDDVPGTLREAERCVALLTSLSEERAWGCASRTWENRGIHLDGAWDPPYLKPPEAESLVGVDGARVAWVGEGMLLARNVLSQTVLPLIGAGNITGAAVRGHRVVWKDAEIVHAFDGATGASKMLGRGFDWGSEVAQIDVGGRYAVWEDFGNMTDASPYAPCIHVYDFHENRLRECADRGWSPRVSGHRLVSTSGAVSLTSGLRTPWPLSSWPTSFAIDGDLVAWCCESFYYSWSGEAWYGVVAMDLADPSRRILMVGEATPGWTEVAVSGNLVFWNKPAAWAFGSNSGTMAIVARDLSHVRYDPLACSNHWDLWRGGTSSLCPLGTYDATLRRETGWRPGLLVPVGGAEIQVSTPLVSTHAVSPRASGNVVAWQQCDFLAHSYHRQISTCGSPPAECAGLQPQDPHDRAHWWEMGCASKPIVFYANLFRDNADPLRAFDVAECFRGASPKSAFEHLMHNQVGAPDLDADGLGDCWQQFYRATLGQAVDAASDLDCDELNNLEEFRWQTIPLYDAPPCAWARNLPGAVLFENGRDLDLDGLWDGHEARYIERVNDGDALRVKDLLGAASDPQGALLLALYHPLKDHDTDGDGLRDIDDPNGDSRLSTDNPRATDTLSDGVEVHVYDTLPDRGDSDCGMDAPVCYGSAWMIRKHEPRISGDRGTGDGFSDSREAYFSLVESGLGTIFFRETGSTNPFVPVQEDEIDNVLLDPDSDGDGLQDGFECLLTHAAREGLGLPHWHDRSLLGPPMESCDPAWPDPAPEDVVHPGLPPFWPIWRGLVTEFHADFCPSPYNPDSDYDEFGDGLELDATTNPCDPDTDGDLMPDGWEARFGLNPLDPSDASLDRDGDGLPSVAEYCFPWDPTTPDGRAVCRERTRETTTLKLGVYWDGLDPSRPDTDNDGLCDGGPTEQHPAPSCAILVPGDFRGERDHGTNPKDPDTDGDGLPDGYESYHGLAPLDPSDALRDDDEDSYASAYHGVDLAWTNLREYCYGRTWWPWAWPGGGCDAATRDYVLEHGVHWNGTNPRADDTDADCALDGWETHWNLDPRHREIDVDPDRDGLSNCDEFHADTKPRLPDTDGDGICDGGFGWNCVRDSVRNRPGEATYGTDPLRRDTDRDGWDDGPEAAYWDPLGTGDVGDCDLDGDNNLLSWDSDGDGLRDADERQAIEPSDPCKPDTDGDGLDDGFERRGWLIVWQGSPLNVTTHPGLVDTDGDGHSDYQEWQDGSHPRKANSYGPPPPPPSARPPRLPPGTTPTHT